MTKEKMDSLRLTFMESFIKKMVEEILGARKMGVQPEKNSLWTIEWIACRGLYTSVVPELDSKKAKLGIKILATKLNRTEASIKKRFQNFAWHDTEMVGRKFLSGGNANPINKFFYDRPVDHPVLYNKLLVTIREELSLDGII